MGSARKMDSTLSRRRRGRGDRAVSVARRGPAGSAGGAAGYARRSTVTAGGMRGMARSALAVMHPAVCGLCFSATSCMVGAVCGDPRETDCGEVSVCMCVAGGVERSERVARLPHATVTQRNGTRARRQCAAASCWDAFPKRAGQSNRRRRFSGLMRKPCNRASWLLLCVVQKNAGSAALAGGCRRRGARCLSVGLGSAGLAKAAGCGWQLWAAGNGLRVARENSLPRPLLTWLWCCRPGGACVAWAVRRPCCSASRRRSRALPPGAGE